MAWTTTGTVSVTNNNAIVYGAGTSWSSSNLVRGGDIFKAPDGKDYQVLSVQSNTQLTLASVYLGTTASGQAYALIHTGLLPAELAVGVSDLQSKYLTTVSQLYEWETSTEPTVPLTNPATNVTTDVKPIAGLIADIETKAPASASTAAGTSNTPAGNIAATNTQDAINELDAKKAALSGASFVGPVLVASAALLGYGPGSGGTVTQATSKTTTVTLNKPSGKITMNAETLAPGGVATFIFNNTIIGNDDLVSVSVGPSPGTGKDYEAWCCWSVPWQCYIAVRNYSSVSRAEAVVLNFAIIKGATA